LIPLGVPLVLGAAALAWYNWARFGSISETGFTYQLAGPYLQKHLQELFLPGYFFQNLYNYLLNPFTVKSSFPFLYPVRGAIRPILHWPLPSFYLAQAVTGILCAVPFTLFAAIPIARLFRESQAAEAGERAAPSLPWITTSLLGSFVFPFLSLLMFFWAAMRYTEDFMPALILLSLLGFWQGYQDRARSPRSRKGKMYTVLGLSLAGLSALIGTLLALSIYSSNGLL
jgi:hypothetical protein